MFRSREQNITKTKTKTGSTSVFTAHYKNSTADKTPKEV
jgi:hypothetical protein